MFPFEYSTGASLIILNLKNFKVRTQFQDRVTNERAFETAEL